MSCKFDSVGHCCTAAAAAAAMGRRSLPRDAVVVSALEEPVARLYIRVIDVVC